MLSHNIDAYFYIRQDESVYNVSDAEEAAIEDARMTLTQFAARMKELRRAAGLTQEQLAKQIGSTVRTISRLETGTQEPTWPAVIALADALGVDCRAFLAVPRRVSRPRRGRPPAEKSGRSRKAK